MRSMVCRGFACIRVLRNILQEAPSLLLSSYLAPLSYQLAQAGCTRNTDGRKTKIDVEEQLGRGGMKEFNDGKMFVSL
jgi:hypothetical protein